MPVAPDLADLDAALEATPGPILFWWRDDDAGRPHPRLRRLLAIADDLATPLALAVVPAWLQPDAADAIGRSRLATVFQHGWEHADHALAGMRKIELGGGADRARLALRLGEGRAILAEAFGPRFLPVMVPPWNRIAPEVEALLPDLGFIAVSGLAGSGRAPHPLPRLDVHIDLFDWRQHRPLALREAARRIADVLAGCAGRPIGLMTHHLVMDDRASGVLCRLLRHLRRSAKVRFAHPSDLVGAA
jgi:hypothetical protein